MLSSTFIFSLNKFFLKLLCRKRLNKWVEFFLLIITGWSSWIYKYLWAYNSGQDFWLFRLILLYVNYYQKMKILPFVVVCCWWKFHSTEIYLAIYHLHLTFTSNSYIKKNNFFRALIISIFLNCEYLGLNKYQKVRRYFWELVVVPLLLNLWSKLK